MTLQVTGAGGSTLVDKVRYIAVSTTPPPQADFAVAPSNGTAPLQVSFIGLANGTGSLQYTWDFGDGIGNATGRNPSYTYNMVGVYNVTCTVTDGIMSGEVIRENCIRVTNNTTPIKPQAMFAASPRNGTSPLEVSFIDQSTGTQPLSWEWYFGDSTPLSYIKNPLHTYETYGKYNVTLKVHNEYGDDLSNQIGFITVQNPKGPVADFTATPVSGMVPLTVSFISQSTGAEPLTYDWNFGDGSSGSNQKNPVHVYTEAGNFTIILNVTNPHGISSAENADMIKVGSAKYPVAAFTATPKKGVAPLTVDFIDQSSLNPKISDPVAYLWNFGDNNTSTAKNPEHVYSFPSNYSVNLTVTQGGISDKTEDQTIVVSSELPPEADFSASPRSGTDPLDVYFTSLVSGSGPFSYKWYFGDNTPVVIDPHPVHRYTDEGVYNVTLQATGTGGSTLVTKTGYIAVSTTPPPEADFAVAPSSGSVPLQVSFIGLANGTGTLQYTWDFGDGIGNASGRNPSYTYGSPGIYNVTCIVTDGIMSGEVIRENCIRALNQTYPAKPQAMFAASPRNGTSPLEVSFIDQSVGQEPISWEWYFGDNTPKVYLKNPVHTFENPGSYDVTLMIHAANGDSIVNNSGFITVQDQSLPNAEFTATPLSGSAPVNVSFIDQSTGVEPLSYLWNFGDGSVESLEKNPVHLYNTPGNYTVILTVTNSAGSAENKKTDLIQVTHADDPNAMFAVNTRTGPAPLNISFIDQSKGTMPLSYNWDFGDGAPLAFVQNPVHKYENPGKYNVTLQVTNVRGSDLVSQNNLIYVIDTYPKALFTMIPQNGTAPLKVYFIDQSILNPSDLSAKYDWNFGDGNTSSESNPEHVYTTPGTYEVQLNVTSQGITDHTKDNVIVEGYPKPTASFTAVPRKGEAPLTVAFIDQSCPGSCQYVYDWNFGDENTSNNKSPLHIYSVPGNYTVTLKVTNKWGISNSTVIDTPIIVVNASPVVTLPKANFTTVISNKTSPLMVQFLDQSTGTPVAWYWRFGDGETSNEKNPSHVYGDYGAYNVSLTVSNSAGSDSKVKDVVVSPPGDLKANVKIEDQGYRVYKFTDLSTGDISLWNLNFGDYSEPEIFESPGWITYHRYYQAGSYPVTLTVSNSLKNDNIIVWNQVNN